MSASGLFPELPVWPARPAVLIEEVIDYQALADWMIYGDDRLELDHSGLLVEEFMWQAHCAKLNTFHTTGIYPSS